MPYVDNSPIDVVMYAQQVTQKHIQKPCSQLYNHVHQNHKLLF
jgi:hypothetical protein